MMHEEKPFRAGAYFLVEAKNVNPEIGHNENIVLKFQADEGESLATMTIATETPQTSTGVLTHVCEKILTPRLSEIFGQGMEIRKCKDCGGLVIDQGAKRCRYCHTPIILEPLI